jgi:peptidylprolyl isomerase
MKRLRRGTAAILVVLVSTTVGCGGKEKKAASQPATANPPAASSVPTTPTNPALARKPVIPKPTGRAPAKLVVQDLVKGTGPAAKAGDSVAVQYVGVSFKTGKQFDASWDHGGQPFTFQLGSGMVIPGWDQGLVGMQVGGRRKLTIPSDLAYGPSGSPPAIGPNETLVFVIDLLRA